MSDITPTPTPTPTPPNGDDEVEYDETEDNGEDSVLIDDPTYVGTDTIYKNSAYVINEPMLTDPDTDEEGTRPGSLLNAEETAEAEELAQQVEADHAQEVQGVNPRQTWKSDTPHPSVGKKNTDS